MNSPNINKAVVKLTKKVLWDRDLTDREIREVYLGTHEHAGMTAVKLKARLLNSYNWYTLVNQLGFDEAKKILAPEIIKRLYPVSLQAKYRYAAELLQE